VVAKSGKLKPAEGEGGLRMMMSPKGRQMTGKTEISRLADTLSNMMDRPVVDLTELKGTYEIDLTWSPDGSTEGGPGGMMKAKAEMAAVGGPGPGGEHKEFDTSDAATIFTALQEKLGLKLDSRKAPVELIVLDHIERTPTEN
jgi:uncharacterized protein (TIGR03435 family)